MTEDLIAYLKLRIITAALNEGWEPQFIEGESRWYFLYNLITKKYYDKLPDENKKYMIYRGNNNVYVYVGMSFGSANCRATFFNSGAYAGSRIVFKSKKLAEYAGRQFAKIYADFCFKKSK